MSVDVVLAVDGYRELLHCLRYDDGSIHLVGLHCLQVERSNSPVGSNHTFEVINGAFVLGLYACRTDSGRAAELVAVGQFQNKLGHHVVEMERYRIISGLQSRFAFTCIDGYEQVALQLLLRVHLHGVGLEVGYGAGRIDGEEEVRR